jgi:hypothetical protein
VVVFYDITLAGFKLENNQKPLNITPQNFIQFGRQFLPQATL